MVVVVVVVVARSLIASKSVTATCQDQNEEMERAAKE